MAKRNKKVQEEIVEVEVQEEIVEVEVQEEIVEVQEPVLMGGSGQTPEEALEDRIDDFLGGSTDRFGRDTRYTLYSSVLDNKAELTGTQSALFSEQALDPYEVKHTQAIIDA